MKFYIRAEFFGHKNACFHAFEGFPNKHECEDTSNFANFNPRAIANTLCRKNNASQNTVFYQQRFARAKKHYGACS